MKACIACGMPMKTEGDFAMGDIQKDYCRFCARENGLMQTYEEKLDSLTSFVVGIHGLDKDAARIAAQTMMAQLPAWKDYLAK